VIIVELNSLVVQILVENKLELAQGKTQKELVVISDKPVNQKIKSALRELLQECEVLFTEDLKPSTHLALQALFRNSYMDIPYPIMWKSKKSELDRHIEIFYQCQEEVDVDRIWEPLCTILIEDGFLNTWTIGNKTYNKAVASAMTQNKPRETSINEEDVKDLDILLNAYPSVDEFLKHI
jgi:hypothetical protein